MNIDGQTVYAGPVYYDEETSSLKIDSPYDHVGETFELSLDITFTQVLPVALSGSAIYMPSLTIAGRFTIIDDGSVVDPVDPATPTTDSAFNAAQWAYITSTH
jgi:hypothetical protein